MKELEITCQIYNNVLDIRKQLESNNFKFKISLTNVFTIFANIIAYNLCKFNRKL